MTLFLNLSNIVRCCLIDVVIQPVGVKQLAGGAPVDDGGLGGVVVGEIVLRRTDGQTLVHIPEILPGQGVRVILRVPGDEKPAVVLALHGEYPGLLRHGQQLQLRNFTDILLPVLGVPGVWDIKNIVKAPEQGGLLFQRCVGEHAEELLGQGVFGDAIVVVQPRLSPPAHVEGGVDMSSSS